MIDIKDLKITNSNSIMEASYCVNKVNYITKCHGFVFPKNKTLEQSVIEIIKECFKEQRL